jgi:predicted nuclease with TOPRIM domain
MPPQKLEVPLDMRYRKLLEDFKQLEERLKEEERKRIIAEQRANDLEQSWPEEGLRFDRLESENKKLRKRLEKKRQNA